MIQRSPNHKVCILSSVHIALDNRVFYREARSLQRAGYDVTLVAVHDRDEIKEGIQILGVPRVARWSRPLLWVTLLRRALATRADLFHFHDPELLLLGSTLRLLTRKPTIYDVHEANADFLIVKDDIPAWLRVPLAGLLRRVEPRLARLQSGLIFADDEIAKAFKRVRRPKTTLFNYPARSFLDQAAGAISHVGQRAPIVLHLGGHKRGRGPWLMVDAFRQVLDVIPKAKLFLVGPFIPASLEEDVRAKITQYGMESSVTITGRVPFEQIGSYLEQAAVGWVAWEPTPKNQKNIPTKLFEYMAYGIPVVSSNLLSIQPFVAEGQNGYLVAADDPSAHASAIVELLSCPERALAMGKQGQGLARSCYNWDEMENRLLAFYRDLLS